jgi:hypothetical protein
MLLLVSEVKVGQRNTLDPRKRETAMEEESKEFQVTAKLLDALNKLANQVAVLNQKLHGDCCSAH